MACNADGILEGQPSLSKYWTEIDGVCTKDSSFFGGTPVLPLEAGWGIVLGFGIFFSVFTSYLVWLDQRYVGTAITSEMFNTAGRTVKTGLTAAVIVSQWTWAATLLQSSNVAFQYGVSGPFWYAAGATIQVLLFGILAIELKRKAPNAHTICEIIDARWGPTAHKVYLYFSILTSIIVSSMLILGGAATVEALTGMDRDIASFFIPMGVILYTMAGGLKATFLASYLHTAIIFVILVIFVFGVYAGFDDLGSASVVYDKLQAVTSKSRVCTPDVVMFEGQRCGPIKDNEDGSPLTMLSLQGLIFGVINIVGNFGTVFVDQSYWQSAIAAKPSSSHKGYLLGGLVWFTIPFALATSMGLSVVALDLPVTQDEANAGLVPPAAAVHFMGKSGAAAVAIMLFMAITSTGSAEQIAVSSLVSYDVYRKYFNPKATGSDILRISRIVIFFFGVFMGVLSIILDRLELSLGWVYLFMGIAIGSAVMPISYVLTWDKANIPGAIASPIIGQVLAVITWVAIAARQDIADEVGQKDAKVTIDTLGQNYPMLYGNIVAILSSGLIHAVWSFAAPQNYNFDEMNKSLTLIDDKLPDLDQTENDQTQLLMAKHWIMKWGIGFTFVMVIVWPVLSVPAGVFTKGYFEFWVAIACIWALVATLFIIILPLYESRHGIALVLRGIFTDDATLLKIADVERKLDILLKDEKPEVFTEGLDLNCRAKLLVRLEPAPVEGDTSDLSL